MTPSTCEHLLEPLPPWLADFIWWWVGAVELCCAMWRDLPTAMGWGR